MSLYYILLIFLILVLAFWLVWKYSPEPLRTVLLWVVSIALVAWVLNILGFWSWIVNVKV